ncbi:hypothetical protein BV898_19316 [Hypsibius exemplaris]|uniref:Uncharacterized protein n=1 Tax=Hypsibius exemplaris TaxID=2072580 RepID=A0A9X6NKM7_HYPEX|nr:hypothetical protein BV898_19316 [Hypsibius exemplaris]
MQSFVALTFFAAFRQPLQSQRQTPQEACADAIVAALSKKVSDHVQIQANKESAFAVAAQVHITATEVVDKALSDARANVEQAGLVAAAALGSATEVVANKPGRLLGPPKPLP